MFNSLIDEILWDDLLQYKFIKFANSEIQVPQNEQVEILQPQKFKDKKIFEDTDGEYVDFVEL